MTCISLIAQNSPFSSCPVTFVQSMIRCWTTHSFHHVAVTHLLSLFSQTALQICNGDSTASAECIMSYAEPLYPTLTAGFRRIGLLVESGLSAYKRQHSDASRWDCARVSGRPRKRRGCFATKGSIGIATWSMLAYRDAPTVCRVTCPCHSSTTPQAPAVLSPTHGVIYLT